MGIGNFGLGCPCCDDGGGGGGGGGGETCENNCLEIAVNNRDDFVWQGLSVHTIDAPELAWCAGSTNRVTVRGYSLSGVGGDIWPGWLGFGQFGGPGNFATGAAFPYIRVAGLGGKVRIVNASHQIASVTLSSPTTTILTLPYTLPGTVGTSVNVAFDIPRVNYANPFDYNVWLDIEIIDHTIVCGTFTTSTILSFQAGTWRKAFGPNNFTRWGISPATLWDIGYRCDCP